MIRSALLKVLVLAGLAGGMAAAPYAYASPVTYSFTVDATSGPLSGQMASGSFTFDSSSIVPGGSNLAVGVLTGLDFTWDGISYSPTTANTGGLGFDSTGKLITFCFGTNPSTGACSPNNGSEWFFVGTTLFGYGVQGDSTQGFGTVTFGLANSATPEPGTLGLLAVSLLCGPVVFRRARRGRV